MSRAIEVSGAGGFIEVGAGGASIDVTFRTATGGGGGAVASVNGQTGVVVLDAADVGADPAGTATGLVDDLSGVTNQVIARTNLGLGTAAVTDTGTGASNTILGNDARLTDARTPTAHGHAGVDITSGTVGAARLGSGTADGTTFLRGDQTWTAPPAHPVGTRLLLPAYAQPNASSGGGWVAGGNYAAGGTWITDGAMNNYVEWVDWLEAGTWTMHVLFTKASNGGVVTPSIGGSDLATIDQYAASSVVYNAVATFAGISIGTSGTTTIRFRAASKHASSSGYYIRVSVVEFVRTA